MRTYTHPPAQRAVLTIPPPPCPQFGACFCDCLVVLPAYGTPAGKEWVPHTNTVALALLLSFAACTFTLDTTAHRHWKLHDLTLCLTLSSPYCWYVAHDTSDFLVIGKRCAHVVCLALSPARDNADEDDATQGYDAIPNTAESTDGATIGTLVRSSARLYHFHCGNSCGPVRIGVSLLHSVRSSLPVGSRW
jgi:hypothetical protein